MNFQQQLRSFRVKAKMTLDQIYRASVLDLVTATVNRTPVLTGSLRNNWFLTRDENSSITTSNVSPSGIEPRNRAIRLLEFVNAKQELHFQNNLPYAARIEYDGHSERAPEGMLRISAMQWGNFVKLNTIKYYGSR